MLFVDIIRHELLAVLLKLEARVGYYLVTIEVGAVCRITTQWVKLESLYLRLVLVQRLDT